MPMMTVFGKYDCPKMEVLEWNAGSAILQGSGAGMEDMGNSGLGSWGDE